jgi:hypothetical protein
LFIQNPIKGDEKMSKINTWFNKIDQLFLLSPSFYTILSGALIGAAINLLTGLIFEKEMSIGVILAILLLFISSASFIRISLILEDLRNEAALKEGIIHPKDFICSKIQDTRGKLWTLLVLALACVTFSIIILYYTVTVVNGG